MHFYLNGMTPKRNESLACAFCLLHQAGVNCHTVPKIPSVQGFMRALLLRGTRLVAVTADVAATSAISSRGNYSLCNGNSTDYRTVPQMIAATVGVTTINWQFWNEIAFYSVNPETPQRCSSESATEITMGGGHFGERAGQGEGQGEGQGATVWGT